MPLTLALTITSVSPYPSFNYHHRLKDLFAVQSKFELENQRLTNGVDAESDTDVVDEESHIDEQEDSDLLDPYREIVRLPSRNADDFEHIGKSF